MYLHNYNQVKGTNDGFFPYMYKKEDEKLYKEFISKASPETLEIIKQKYQEYCKYNEPNHQIILCFAQKGINPNDETLAVWYDKEREALIENGIEFVDVTFHLVAETKYNEDTTIHATIVCRKPIKEKDQDSIADGERDDR